MTLLFALIAEPDHDGNAILKMKLATAPPKKWITTLKAVQNATQEATMSDLPQEVMVWHSPTLDHIGTWATTRYPDDAVAYVPSARLEAVEKERDRLNELLHQVRHERDCFVTGEAAQKKSLSQRDCPPIKLKPMPEGWKE